METKQTKCKECGGEMIHKVYDYSAYGTIAECDSCTECKHEINREVKKVPKACVVLRN